MENLITSYELRAAIMEEKRNRERELQEMAVQDVSFSILYHLLDLILLSLVSELFAAFIISQSRKIGQS